MTNEAKIVITADGSQAVAVAAQVKREAMAMGEAFRQSAGSATQSTRALNAALRTLPAQITDIVTGLASGQAPLTVLLQQGGQLKDVFGGIGPAARAVGGYILGLVNPYTLAAAAVAGLGAAYLAADGEQSAFARGIILSGNAAGTTVARLQALSAQIADSTGATQGRTSEVLAGLVSEGRLTEDQLAKVAEAALAMEQASGEAAEKTAEAFQLIARAPAEALDKLDKAQNVLTTSTYANIRALLEQGRSTEAAQALVEAYADALKSRAGEVQASLSSWEQGWKRVKEAAKDVVDALKEPFRGTSPEQQAQSLSARIASEQAVADALRAKPYRNAIEQDDLKTTEARLAAMREELGLLDEKTAKNKAAVDAQAEQNQIQKQAKEFIDLAALSTNKQTAATTELVDKLRNGYLATLQQIAAANPGKDPLNTAEGIIATEKYRAKIAEIATEVNKTSIAGEQALREKLTAAMEDGRAKAEKLRDEIKGLNAELLKIGSGQGEYAQKAQALRDKSLTPEQADAKNTAAAKAALDEAKSLTVFAQNAAIDGRAEDAQRYAQNAADLIKTAADAAGKISDSDFAAKIFDQLNSAQKAVVESQKAIKEQQLTEVQAQTQAQAEQLAQLEQRLAALKSGATIQVEVPTEAAVAQANAIQAAIDAIPTQKTVTVTVQQVGSAGATDAAPADVPGRAFGGPIPGYSPHARADNVLIRATAGEYMMQVPAVNYYGRDFMRRVNAMQLPRYAFGGEIGAPFIGTPRIPSVAPVADASVRATFNISGVGTFDANMSRVDADALEARLARVLNREALAHGRRR